MNPQTPNPKTPYTAGPWFTLDTGLDVYSEYQPDPDYLPRRRHIAAAITTCQFDQEARANAALIAAAPELLNALILAEATIERLQRHAPGTANGTLDVIRNAIKNATP